MELEIVADIIQWMCISYLLYASTTDNTKLNKAVSKLNEYGYRLRDLKIKLDQKDRK